MRQLRRWPSLSSESYIHTSCYHGSDYGESSYQAMERYVNDNYNFKQLLPLVKVESSKSIKGKKRASEELEESDVQCFDKVIKRINRKDVQEESWKLKIKMKLFHRNTRQKTLSCSTTFPASSGTKVLSEKSMQQVMRFESVLFPKYCYR